MLCYGLGMVLQEHLCSLCLPQCRKELLMLLEIEQQELLIDRQEQEFGELNFGGDGGSRGIRSDSSAQFVLLCRFAALRSFSL